MHNSNFTPWSEHLIGIRKTTLLNDTLKAELVCELLSLSLSLYVTI